MDNKLRIIGFLGRHKGESFTMLETSKLLGIPYATFHRTLGGMADLVMKNKKGNTTLIEVKARNPIVTPYMALSSYEEKKEAVRKQALLKEIDQIETSSIVVVFGSYAKGKQRKDSDLDLLVINKRGEKDMSFSKLELIYRKKINPIYVSESEFKDMLGDEEENVGKQALKHNIVLKGHERFWELVYGR